MIVVTCDRRDRHTLYIAHSRVGIRIIFIHLILYSVRYDLFYYNDGLLYMPPSNGKKARNAHPKLQPKTSQLIIEPIISNIYY